MLRTLPLYVIKEITPPVVISGLFFSAVMLFAELIDLASTLLRAGIGGVVLLQLIGIMTVTLLTMTIPMAVLLGVLIGVGRLTAENEILAMRASGISLLRVFFPVLLASLLVAGGLAAANAFLIPRMFQSIQSIVYEMQINVLSNLKPGRFYDELGGGDSDMTLYFEEKEETPAEEMDTGYLGMRGVNMRMDIERGSLLPSGEEEGESDVEFLIFAERGTIRPDFIEGTVEMSLENGSWISLSDDEKMEVAKPGKGGNKVSSTVMRFGKLETEIGGVELDDPDSAEPTVLEVTVLWQLLQDPPAGPVYHEDGDSMRRVWRRYYSLRHELIQRFTLPLAAVAFTLIAIPLAMEIRPRAKSLSVLIAVALMLVYYMLMTLGASIGTSGVGWVVAISAAMIPNVVIGLVGIVLLYRAIQR